VNDEPGVGAQGTVIVSRQFWNAVVHLNAGFAYTRGHNADLVGSIIMEGPRSWPVKPVFELFSEHELGGPSAVVTGLVGMIWRKSDALAFDAGIRVARAAGEGLVEGRLGLTFAVDVLNHG
jgi:hypothetical protein